MWSDFESDIVEGRYPLAKLVRSEGRCGWFETHFDGKAAIISLIESINDEAMLLERLRAAQKISNKNVAIPNCTKAWTSQSGALYRWFS